MKDRILDLNMQGYCCSQIIMQIGLDNLGKENTDLIVAMKALCNGLQEGKLCGCLTAASCVLYLADSERAATRLNTELMEWFDDTFGALDCNDLLEGNPLNKIEKCPMIIEATCKKLEDLLDW